MLSSCGGGNWTKEDTARQVAYGAVHIIDWGQTRDISKSGKEELNLYLGKHPSLGKVDTYFISTLAIHTLVSYSLTPRYRKWWQYLTFGVETGVVVRNYNLGVKVDF